MTTDCDFSYEHYRYVLETAIDNGYRFASFDDEKIPLNHKVIFVHHDIDVSPIKAVKIARIENNLGIKSTYFFMKHCPTYSLYDKETRKAIDNIRDYGHWIGRHVSKFEYRGKTNNPIYNTQVYSIHKPEKDELGKKTVPNNTYASRFIKDCHYISDSRGVWHNQCPCKSISSCEYKQYHILFHPIWYGPGTKRHKMDSILENRILELREYAKEILC